MEASRGCQAGRWQAETVLDRGCGLATVYYSDIEPDLPEGAKLGLRATLSSQGKTPSSAERLGRERRLSLGG